MSSKDLRGIELLGKYIACGVDSIKIEGRMKGAIYAATTAKVYREALDCWKHQGEEGLRLQLRQWQEELETFSHRDYTVASLLGPAGPDSIHDEREELKKRSHKVLGTVVATTEEGEIIVSVKNTFSAETKLEVLPFKGPVMTLPSSTIKSLAGAPLTLAKQSTLVRLVGVQGVERWNMVRGR